MTEAISSERNPLLKEIRRAAARGSLTADGFAVAESFHLLEAALASTAATQGVIALVRPPRWTVEQLLRGKSLVVVLDGVQDPGNAGAIVRAAEAFGATGVAFLKGSASAYNPKSLRASAGSIFRLPIVAAADENLLLAALDQRGVALY